MPKMQSAHYHLRFEPFVSSESSPSFHRCIVAPSLFPGSLCLRSLFIARSCFPSLPRTPATFYLRNLALCPLGPRSSPPWPAIQLPGDRLPGEQNSHSSYVLSPGTKVDYEVLFDAFLFCGTRHLACVF